MEQKQRRGRKPQVKLEQSLVNEEIVNEVVQDSVQIEQEPAPQTPQQEVSDKPAYMYKCIECGQVNLVKRCKRCSGSILRPISGECKTASRTTKIYHCPQPTTS